MESKYLDQTLCMWGMSLCILYMLEDTFLLGAAHLYITIGIKHGFSCINIRQVHERCWEPRPKATVFNISQGTWWMLMHWKTMFDRYHCIKTEKICCISHYFLHYFVLDYALSRAGQYTSRNGSKSVAPIRSYWKLRSHALTARELPC